MLFRIIGQLPPTICFKNISSASSVLHRSLSTLEKLPKTERKGKSRLAVKSYSNRFLNENPDHQQSSVAKSLHLFASTLPGLESILSDELETKLNILKQNQLVTDGGITFDVASVRELYQCHLHLGSASHIFLRAPVSQVDDAGSNDITNGGSVMDAVNNKKHTFYAIHEKQLVQKVRKMNIWSEIISISDQQKLPKLDIRVSSTKSKLHHTGLIADCIERGVYKALGYKKRNKNQSLHKSFNNKEYDDQRVMRILVRIHRDEVQVSIDTSLTPLHKRGYKLAVGKAPLREDIAFAFLYSLGWSNSLSSSYSLVDPFCGAGTIVIEGASMAKGLPPGRLRPPPCQFTNFFNEKMWEEMVQKSSSLDDINQTEVPLIIGSDRDDGAIKSSIENAKRAGVENFIQLESSSISANPWLKKQKSNSTSTPIIIQRTSNVLIATNPPFGLRISPSSKSLKNKQKKGIHPLLPLYQTLGNIVEDLKKSDLSGTNSQKVNLNIGILSHDMNLARKSGVSDLKKKFTTKLGGIQVTGMGNC